MIPTSDQLEAFRERLIALNVELSKLHHNEVRKATTIAEIKDIAKLWLRYSEALRSTETLSQDSLNLVDEPLKELLHATDARTRSSSYRRTLKPVLTSFTERIVIPVIRFEGSPSQVAARQLIGVFSGQVAADELSYLEEAAKCLGRNCNRAAIIMLWAATMARFHRAIEKLGFNAYNVALTTTTQKGGIPFNKVSKTSVMSLPELQRSRDFDLIVVGMELWKYDLQVFSELDRLLGTRNDCAHPGMATPLAIDVQQFASKVSTYVFGRVPV